MTLEEENGFGERISVVVSGDAVAERAMWVAEREAIGENEGGSEGEGKEEQEEERGRWRRESHMGNSRVWK